MIIKNKIAFGLICFLGLNTSIMVQATEIVTSIKSLKIVKNISKKIKTNELKNQKFQGYLLVYFKDETHDLYFATSTDGYAFTDINNGNPILFGKDLAEQRGIRDPHIFRGPNNAFYMSLTDLHIFAKDKGFRTTTWERPSKDYGWGNNKNLILMKSYDLINWTHSIVNVEDIFPELTNLAAVWAPQTIYDKVENKLMLYYTTRHKNNRESKKDSSNYMVYAYTNDEFTTLTTTPKKLFNYPIEGVSTIDADITKVNDQYHLFYVANDEGANIKQAISSNINNGFVFDAKKIDPESVPTEAPNLWRRIGTDTYVLMYDVYGANPKNNMGFSETTDFVNFKNIGRFNEPNSKMKATNFTNPKHGTVIPISKEEMARINHYFK
ncbi:MAG: glycoside hydrolase family 43 protein [Colwellia sp.]